VVGGTEPGYLGSLGTDEHVGEKRYGYLLHRQPGATPGLERGVGVTLATHSMLARDVLMILSGTS
jgi:hypothetical protein